MCVPLVEFLCQMAMGWIPALKYLLSGVHGLLWLHHVAPGSKCCRFPRPRPRYNVSSAESPQVKRLDAQTHPVLGREVDRDDRWQNPAYP
jgi:hypothetical protein